MSVIVTTAFVGMVQPAAPAAVARIRPAPAVIEDGYRHRPIGSLPAFGLALCAALMTTAVMWVAL